MYPEYFQKYSNIVTSFWYEFIICKFSVRVKKVRKRDGTENIKKASIRVLDPEGHFHMITYSED